MRRPLVLLAAAVLCAAAAPAPGARLLEDDRILSADDMQGRLVGTEGSAKARAYIIGRLREIGVTPAGAAFEAPFSFTDKAGDRHDGVNIVGQIRGTGSSKGVLVISAHYDHLGVRKGEVYNGADDNASGVAALLAVAEALRQAPPKHTVLFAFFDGEEEGERGSKAFVAAPPVPLSRVALNVNLDMVARGDKGELYVAGAHYFPFLKPRLERLAAGAPVTLKLGHDGAPPFTGHEDWTDQSDHFAFHEKHVPWVYFGVEDHPDYHRPTDDFAKIPQDFFRGAARTVTTAVQAFDADLDEIAKDSARSD